jgi:hypothetical protein
MPAKKKTKPQEICLNNTLPIFYVDTIATGHRKGFNYLSFATNLPNRIVEQVRLIIDDESLYLIIDSLCRTTNHFPEKPIKKKRSPSK